MCDFCLLHENNNNNNKVLQMCTLIFPGHKIMKTNLFTTVIIELVNIKFSNFVWTENLIMKTDKY